MSAAGHEAGRDSVGPPTGAPHAERRQLTAMFCDVVDSTRIAAEIGDENWYGLLRDYRPNVERVIERYGGSIGDWQGDGVLAFFGHPESHEDDAERAVHAGLAIVEAVAAQGPEFERKHGHCLSVRIGIHTGTVVVGEVSGAVGVHVNIASRVHGKAAPNQVVITATTLNLVRGIFVTESLGTSTLAGVPDEIELHRVTRATAAADEPVLRSGGALTPFVGREAEMAKLLASWHDAREGRGGAVVVSGEAGIGKSRLLTAFREQLGNEAQGWLVCRASKFHGQSAYYPMSTLLEGAFGLRALDSDAEKLAIVVDELERAGLDGDEASPLFAGLLGLSTSDQDAPSMTSAEARRQRTVDSLVSWFLAQSSRRPIIVVVEDLHWLDPSTLDVVEALMDRTSGAPLLVVSTHRLDFTPSWAPQPHIKHMELGLLTRAQTTSMIDALTADTPLPANVRQQLVSKTDRIPLYVEELVLTMQESQANPGRMPELAVPPKLESLLMARLDRLGSAKGLAQLAAVLGRDFSLPLLQAASEGTESDEEHLARLVHAGVVQRVQEAGEAVYTFKHALIQKRAYESLLKTTRQEWHAHVARVIEERFPDHVAAEPDQIARHCEEGRLLAKAAAYYQRAAEQASLRSATAQTLEHLRRGVRLLEQSRTEGPGEGEQELLPQLELLLQLDLGIALLWVEGWASTDAVAAYERARTLSREVGEPQQVFLVMRGLLAFYLGRGELDKAEEALGWLSEVAEESGDSALMLVARRQTGTVRYFRGDSQRALELFKQATQLHDPAKHRPLSHALNEDIGVFIMSWEAWALWMAGYPDQALEKGRQSLEHAEEGGHTFSVANAYFWAAILHVMRREPDEVRRLAERAIAIAEPRAYAFILSGARTVHAWAALQAADGPDETRAAAEGFRDSILQVGSTGNRANAPMLMCYLAEALHRAGQSDGALFTIGTGMAVAGSTGQVHWDAELHRMKAQIAWEHQGDEEAAERLFLQALETAKAQRAKVFELRAAVGLGRLWASRGEHARARDLVAPIYGQFTEGFDTPDLADARSLTSWEPG
ncbi:MAG: ATP-binding protein [Polyangiales bacterium]